MEIEAYSAPVHDIKPPKGHIFLSPPGNLVDIGMVGIQRKAEHRRRQSTPDLISVEMLDAAFGATEGEQYIDIKPVPPERVFVTNLDDHRRRGL